MAVEPLFHPLESLRELTGFVSRFLAAGAVGFRFTALRSAAPPDRPDERALAGAMGARAAGIGLAGCALGLALQTWLLPETAARMHRDVPQLFSGLNMVSLAFAFPLLAIAGFAAALAGRRTGWALAAAGVIAGALRPALFLQWTRLVNPLHVLAGGLWIGTLFVMVAIGLPAILAAPLTGERRGAIAAAMVNAFTPLALGSAALLAASGALTAWRHLGRLSALWTSPYGATLIVKLCVVACVAGLGAWNWRRQKARMGGEAGARALLGSARAEVLIAGAVLLITSILVSLPSPAER
jgi:copper transport protein